MADKLNLVVPEQVVLDTKMKALKEGVSVSAVVRGFLEDWLAGKLETPEIAKTEGKNK